jgi:hypothetical protein
MSSMAAASTSYVLAFLDPLLAGAALMVEAYNPLCRARSYRITLAVAGFHERTGTSRLAMLC